MSENLIYLTDDNFEREIASGVTLVDFYATWCGPCKMIAPVVEELAKEMHGKAKIAKLNIEDNAEQTTSNFHITSVPTLIVFKGGKEVKRVVGVKDKQALKTLINSVL